MNCDAFLDANFFDVDAKFEDVAVCVDRRIVRQTADEIAENDCKFQLE